MKRLFIILLSVISLATYAQRMDIRYYNLPNYIQNVDMGIDLGIGNESEFMFGVDLSIYGIYVDAIFHPANHSSDIRVDQWNDNKSHAFHIGYKIPISKHIAITPLYGIYKFENGITDGSRYYISYSGGIQNKFIPKSSFSDNDFGAKIEYMHNYCTYNGINLGIRVGMAATKYTKYVNFSFAVYFK